MVGIRTHVGAGTRITRSVLLGADFYEDTAGDNGPALGIGRNVVLDRVIVDKNARIGDGVRLLNEKGVDDADGDGYVIRDGIIIVPKNAAVTSGVTTMMKVPDQMPGAKVTTYCDVPAVCATVKPVPRKTVPSAATAPPTLGVASCPAGPCGPIGPCSPGSP